MLSHFESEFSQILLVELQSELFSVVRLDTDDRTDQLTWKTGKSNATAKCLNSVVC